MSSPDVQVDDLLTTWEQVYKKGLLSFWLLLFLHKRPAYAYELAPAIAELSRGSITVDENSIYRALNRFEGLGIVKSESRGSNLGPPRRYYHLTRAGISLLARFIRRNILVFEDPAIAGCIRQTLSEESGRIEED